MLKKRLILSVIIISALVCFIECDTYAGKRLKVVTSVEFLEDWAKKIGKDLVDVEHIHDSRLDVHFFEPRPVHVKKCSKADVFITPGLDLDVWLQPLLDASRNPKIQYGTIGYIDASFGVNILEKPSGRVDMSMGDVHPYGNPHYFYNLRNVQIALENIAVGLSKNDQDNTEFFNKNKEEYWQEVQTTFKTLKELMEPFKGTKIVTYHKSWEYFAEEFGFEIVGYFEPKPGIPPSPRHLKQLIDAMKQHKVEIILKEPYYPKRSVKKLSRQTGAVIVELVNFPGCRSDAPTYLANLKANINDLLKTIKG